MHQGKPGETPEEIVEHAGITKRRFRDWRERGLVPRPIARPSRGHARGRAAFYPEGTADLCRAIARKMEEVYRLDDAAAELWLKGYPLSGYMRQRLLERIEEEIEEQQRYREVWQESLESDAELPRDHPVWRAQFGRPEKGWINRVLSPGERFTLTHLFLESLSGDVPEDLFASEEVRRDPEAMAVVEKVVRAALEKHPARLKGALTSEQDLLREHLHEAMGSYSLPQLADELKEMDEDDYDKLRDEVVHVLDRWSGGVDRPLGTLAGDVCANLLIFRTMGIPIVKRINDLLGHKKELAQQLGRVWRDHLLGSEPIDRE